MKSSLGSAWRCGPLSSHRIRCACLAAVALVSIAGPVAAQQGPPYQTFDEIPYAYAQDLGRFRSIFQTQARAGTVRVAWMGDSQETSPAGAGAAYVPRLGYEFFRRYGNVPETQLSNPVTYSSASPPGEFLLQGATLDREPSRQPPSRLPPGV